MGSVLRLSDLPKFECAPRLVCAILRSTQFSKLWVPLLSDRTLFLAFGGIRDGVEDV